MRVEDLSAYEIIEKRRIEDIDSLTYLCRHKKTGARVALISNRDENKVFYIGFRTPPKDSTGVAHILEHSVLCGSKDYPLKDPFVELVKGSLNTFLNAMTYPDKTVYPLASCNDKDFQNLMDVYLNAVFYPNIYSNEAIFRQEGWHYELDDQDELTYNGVVYNEMKGAFSDPKEVLDREIPLALYPSTAYAVDSGGDPKYIPDLGYEQFLEFHRTYYHPSNSYIYLYGDMDMAEKLQYIDEVYLSHFDACRISSEITMEQPFTEPVRVEKEIPVSEGENEEDSTYLALAFSVGSSLDRELAIAMQVIQFALCNMPGAPLKKMLVEQGIAKDMYGVHDNGYRQPYFSIVAKGTKVSNAELFQEKIREILSLIVTDGIGEKALLSAINHFEFRYREADFGSYPKGLMYGLQMLDSWLHDDRKPFIHIEANETFKLLRERVKEGYFENLVRRYLLENTHSALVVLKPKAGLAKEQEEALRQQLQEIRASMNDSELQGVRDMMQRLEDFRETEDDPEAIAKLSLLTRADLKREVSPVYNTELTIGGTPALYHDIFTNGIGYLRLIFKFRDIPREYLRYLGIFRNIFCQIDTENYSYGELCQEINLVTGEIFVTQNNYGNVKNPDAYTQTFEICTKALYDKLPQALALMEELVLRTRMDDTKRLRELIAEGNSKERDYMNQAGHVVAIGRALSYVGVKDALEEEISGIDLYRMSCELEEQFEERKEELCEKLKMLCRMIFRPENLMIDFTGDRSALEALAEPVADFKEKLYTCKVPLEHYEPVPVRKQEGFTTSGQVDYVCRAGNFLKKGLKYHGALAVLRVMMGYEYLWVNVRVKGGAYGCMCNFNREGGSYFCSYRDPNLGETIEVFEKAADFVANYEADDRTMTQYIIGAIGAMDTPISAAGKGRRSKEQYFTGLTQEMRQEARNQVLDATPEDIRMLAEYIRAFLEDDCLCVVGNGQQINKEQERFETIENLL